MSIIKWLSKEEMDKEFSKELPEFLDDKINEYLEWYYRNMIKGKYSKKDEYSKISSLQNFIDKMAIWYELRYPNYEVNKIIPYKEQEEKNVDEEMFEKNPYVNKELEEDSLTKALNWDEFYNTSVFVRSLPEEEKSFLKRPQYRKNNEVEIANKKYHISSNGTVVDEKSSDKICLYDKDGRAFEFNGLKIEQLFRLLNLENFDISRQTLKELREMVIEYKNEQRSKNDLLNAVMYKIIERGGPKLGARRALLFAKEFGRNVNIPMQYGVYDSDNYQRALINEYVKMGGSKYLKCYVNYKTSNKKQKLEVKTIEELLESKNLNTKESYTNEEKEMHQKLVNVLWNRVDKNKLKEEQLEQRKNDAKRLRLQKKLVKSKNR